MSDPRGLLDLVATDAATVPALMAARVARTPEAPFLRWEGRGWSYREAWEEALRFAAWARRSLPESGARRVACFLPNRPEAVWAWLGTLAAGATYVPLNRAHRGEILADMIARSGARVAGHRRRGPCRPPRPRRRRDRDRPHRVGRGAGAGARRARRTPAGRPGRADVHLGHDRALEGGRAES